MNNYAAKLILLLLINVNSFALPGMSTVSYDFTLNSEIFSKAAVHCQNKEKSDFGLQNIANFMGKMNCNNILDPDAFCKCVSLISNKGLNISDKERAEVDRIIDQESEKKIIEVLAGNIESIEGYGDLVSILGSQFEKTRCLKKMNDDDPIFGRMLTKEKAKEPLTLKEKLLKAVLNKFKKDVEEVPTLRLEEVVDDAIKLKNFALLDARQSNSNPDAMQSDVQFDVSSINWSKLNDSAITRMLRKDPLLGTNLDRVRKYQSSGRNRDFSPNLQVNAVHKIKQILDLNPYSSSNTFMSTVQGRFSGTQAEEVVTSAISNACKDFKVKVDSMVENTDIKQSKRSIKAAMFNPKTDEQKETFKIIEEALSNRLFSQQNEEDKKGLQEFSFNIDLLYCQDRRVVKTAEAKSGTKNIISKLRKDVSINAAELELAKQSKSEGYNEFKNARAVYDDLNNKESMAKERVSIYEDLLNGKYIVNIDGQPYIDIHNDELIDRAFGIDEDLYHSLVMARMSGENYSISKSRLSIQKETAEIGYKFIKEKSAKAKKELEVAEFQYNESVAHVTFLEVEQDKYISALEQEVGSGNALNIVAGAEHDVNESLGRESSIEMVFRNERRKKRKTFSIRDAINGTADNVITGNLKKTTLPGANSTSSVNSGSSSDYLNSGSSSKADEQAGIMDTMAKEMANRANVFTNTSSPNVNTGVRSDVNVVGKESRSLASSDREKELEKQLAELEKIVSANAVSDGADSAAPTTSSSSVDNQIKELKEKIELEKIRAEKAKVSKQIKELKSSSAPTATASVSRTNSTTPQGALQRASFTSRSPSSTNSRSNLSSSSVANTRSSGGEFSSGSLPSSSGPSSVNNGAPSSATRSTTSTVDGSNFEKSKTISLNGGTISGVRSSGGIEISSFNGEASVTNARIVKVDFDLSTVNSEKQEELLEALFIDGEEQIIIETLEGKKIIVKNTLDKGKKNDKKNEDKRPTQNKNKMRHQNLIDLLKVGQTSDSL